MYIGILHLSDIHINGPTHPVLNRAASVARALALLPYELEMCVLAVTGDIAFSGRKEQYGSALSLLRSARNSLTELPQIKRVETIVVPGNHDLDLDASDSIRNLIVDNVQAGALRTVDTKILQSCLTVQDEFFNFAAELNEDGAAPHNRLQWSVSFSCGDTTIQFDCYNTAWLSTKHEQQGKLRMPMDLLAKDSGPAAHIAMAMFHHPYNWFEADNARAFRRHVEERSDIILTGHEHNGGQYTKRNLTGQVLEYIEGAAMQMHGTSGASAFNFILIDASNQRWRLYQYEWEDKTYRENSTNDRWQEFRNARRLAQSTFVPTEKMRTFLDDAGAKFTHPSRERVRLPDLFVYPDLRETKYSRQDAKTGPFTTITSDRVAHYVLSGTRTLITGDDECGKTTLAKSVYRDAQKQKIVPLYIDASGIRSGSEDDIRELVMKHVVEQYGAAASTRYHDLDPDSRLLLLDNFHRIGVKPRARLRVLQSLHLLFKKSVVLGDDSIILEHVVRGTREDNPFSEYRTCSLPAFGYVLRDRLIEKWLQLDTDIDPNNANFARRVAQTSHKVETVLGRNLIPSYPLFILIILQQLEAGTPLDTPGSYGAGSLGYLYEALITKALASGSLRIDIDTKHKFLSVLAYQIFRNGRKSLSMPQVIRLYVQYCADYRIEIPMHDLLNDLVACSILESDEDEFSFKYKYMYYYFVARHVHDDAEETARVVENLVRALHHEESANIVLFLAYLSRDPSIIECVLNSAQELYQDIKPCDLDKDLAFLSSIQDAVAEIELEASDPKANREAMLRERDQVEQETGLSDSGSPSDDDDLKQHIDAIVQINVATKTMQILGQILKNRPGSLKADLKYRVARECYLLGLRTMNAIFGLMQTQHGALARDVAELLRRDGVKGDKLRKRSESYVFWLCELVALFLVRRVANSVGLDKLGGTFDDVLQRHPSVPISMIDTAVRLEHFPKFPESEVIDLAKDTKGRFFAATLLRMLVRDHFHLYPSDTSTKQRICEHVGIQIKTLPPVSPKHRRRR